MPRYAIPLAIVAVAVLLGAGAWRHHLRAGSRRSYAPASEPALAAALALPAQLALEAAWAAPVSSRHGDRTGFQATLGAEPTAAEVEAVVRLDNAERERRGGVTMTLATTGQPLPTAHSEVRGYRFIGPCLAHEHGKDHPYWICTADVEMRAPFYQPEFAWQRHELELAHMPDGGVDHLQQAVRYERGQARD